MPAELDSSFAGYAAVTLRVVTGQHSTTLAAAFMCIFSSILDFSFRLFAIKKLKHCY